MFGAPSGIGLYGNGDERRATSTNPHAANPAGSPGRVPQRAHSHGTPVPASPAMPSSTAGTPHPAPPAEPHLTDT